MKLGLAVKHPETCNAKNKHNNFTDGCFMAAAIFFSHMIDFQYHMTFQAVLLISERNVQGGQSDYRRITQDTAGSLISFYSIKSSIYLIW